MMKNIIVIFGIFFLVACGSKKSTEDTTQKPPAIEGDIVVLTDAQMAMAKIELGKVERRSISSVIKLNGKIDVPPQNLISVSMPLGGYLKSTKLLPGMHINKGELIAIMEDQQYIQIQQDYLITKNKLEFAKAEYIRQKELNASKATSDKLFQQSEMEYKSLLITLSALDAKLKLININTQKLTENTIANNVKIYSQISGFVSKVNVNIGKYVNPTDVLFELINPSDFHLNLKVFEKDIDKLSIRQKLMAYSNNFPDKKYDCEIILISRDISLERTVDVHCHFEKYDKNLLPGMYMNADVEVKTNNTFSISEDAIVNFEGLDYVFVAKDKLQFQMVKVEVGSKENGFIEVKNNRVFLDKQIVINGAYTLLMKMKNKSED
ncbi:MAG: efflux RND transporter periplasmic adaptor subunit [Arcicella sp.]|nr:efflux RND transporter periplasmic adaptor subunit [Arcicella sp.]